MGAAVNQGSGGLAGVLGGVPGRPIVAVVGRANVGKSTLFNRLLRKRVALVEDRPGVTRDRIVAPAEVEGRTILLVDTGGLDPDAETGIPGAVRRQVEDVLEASDLVLLVVDARSGPLPLDREIADLLRKGERPVLVVANKADTPRFDAEAGEFHSLGFPAVVPVSSEHRRGLADLEVAIAERLPPAAAHPAATDAEVPRLAIVGRPNVGKSSLLNHLLGQPHAIVSPEPGTTRDATDARLRVGGREVVLVDTAGLRRPARRTGRLEHGSALMAIRSIERADIALLVLDGSEGITDQDARIASLALQSGRPLVLVVNKCDLVAPDRLPEVERQLERKLGFVRDPVVVHTSAVTGAGTSALLERALRLHQSARIEASTAELNRALEEAVRRCAPPLAGARRPRFYYATQVSLRPFSVLVFVNDPALVTESYHRYLESFFRKRFGIRSAPVRVVLRARQRRGAPPGAHGGELGQGS